MRILKKLVCRILGHKPVNIVEVELDATPLGEPTLDQFVKWTGIFDVIGVAHSDNYLICERCGEKLECQSRDC